MTTLLSVVQRKVFFIGLTQAVILSGVLLWAGNVLAMPRVPLPPVPEQTPLYHESFDEDYFWGETNAAITIEAFGTLDESWSGYALDRTGETVVPFIVPALASSGSTNVACDVGGTLRFWIKPLWSSQSQTNGSGPGTVATLLELDAVSGGETAFAWSLQTSADGNTLNLMAETGGGIQTALQSQISWQAGQSHCLVLDFNQAGTTLFLDGTLLGQGAGVPSVPCSVGQLVIGSAYSGANPAGADVEEFYSFDSLQTNSDVAAYYQLTAATAALGPASPEEQTGRGGLGEGFETDSIRSPGNVYDPDHDITCSPGGPFYITNVFAGIQTNGNTTVTFDIQGGTNGVFYDIFTTTNLDNNIAENEWTWIGQGLTCNTYTFSNQPVGVSFYVLEMPSETFTIAFDGENDSDQLDTPSGLSNVVAISAGGGFSLALRNNGTVIGWGDNEYGQTNIPVGLTNVIAIAAGDYHGVALLANGSVTNWGWYQGSSNYCSVTNRLVAGAPPTSGVVAIAAGLGQDMGLLSNGTVIAWGFTNVYGGIPAYGATVPTNLNLTNVSAIACGWEFDMALSSNGTITAWGDDIYLYPVTNVPSDLTTNTAAIAAGGEVGMALRKNGTVETWGYANSVVTNIPAGLSNVVAIATGGSAGLALQGNGTVAAWGDVDLTNIPPGMLGVKAISSGFDHNLVIESGILNPVIFEQPISQYAPPGHSVTFSAEGDGVAGVQYQWQFNGTNITGATNSTLTLSDTQAADNGDYDVIIYTSSGSITSSTATFTLVVAPQVGSMTPTNTGITWINYLNTLSVQVTNIGQADYPITYGWNLNGTNLGDNSSSYLDLATITNDGIYTVGITNVAGTTNVTLNVRVALPGMVEAWGSDYYGECDRPASLTNATAIAAGEYQSVAVTDTGSVAQWGQYWNGTSFYSITNTNYVTLAPTSGVVAVAAGMGQVLGLMTNGTVTAWGLTGAYGNSVPSGLSGVKAISCGWQFDVALLTNGTVISWGSNSYGQTNVPPGLTNVIAIAAGPLHTLALKSNGTVVAWGYNPYGETNVPANLSNVVAIAAGDTHNLVLLSNGTVVAWGYSEYGQTNVPAGLSNVMAVAAGDEDSVALLNNGTVVVWGDNSNGQTNVPGELPTTVITTYNDGITITNQTNVYPPIVVKMIAAGGEHVLASIFSPLVQYPIDVSKDLLLIYNTNSTDSSNVCQYYLTHRPMVSNANLLGIGCTTNESFASYEYTNVFLNQVTNWLATNPTKRPPYVILFQDIPSRVDADYVNPSVQYQLHYWCSLGWTPFVSSINMNGTGGTNDCIGYINKLALIGSNYSSGQLILSARGGGYENTNWYIDDTAASPYSGGDLYSAVSGITNFMPNASIIYTNDTTEPANGTLAGHITSATNLAAFASWGIHGYNGGTNAGYATNGTIRFSLQAGWYLIETVESYNGFRIDTQGNFLSWYAANAFGGTNYSNTPAGAVSNVQEPTIPGINNPYWYFGYWADGRIFVSCAWNSFPNITHYPQVVGDPFIKQ